MLCSERRIPHLGHGPVHELGWFHACVLRYCIISIVASFGALCKGPRKGTLGAVGEKARVRKRHGRPRHGATGAEQLHSEAVGTANGYIYPQSPAKAWPQSPNTWILLEARAQAIHPPTKGASVRSAAGVGLLVPDRSEASRRLMETSVQDAPKSKPWLRTLPTPIYSS